MRCEERRSRTRSRFDAKSTGEDPLTLAIISIRFNATRRASQSNPQPIRCQVNGGRPPDTCNYLNSFQCDAKSVPVEPAAGTTPSQWGKTP
ncbi:hypothetical protein SESBI_08286 [Sesbania bispinosa]|nr:hypothetical protein SESBI_08286 [Sesbania bispinosa]